MEEIKKNNSRIVIFIIAAVALLLFVTAAALIRAVGFNDISAVPDAGEEDKYTFKEKVNNKDPYITVNPNLEKMLAGPVISKNDPSLGSPEANLVAVIFSDFECKFCQAQVEKLEQLMDNYKDKIRLIWKDYPSQDENSTSFLAAVAGRCAQAQEEFWSFHEILYNIDDGLNRDNIVEAAESVGLNSKKFEECLRGEAAADLVRGNIEEAEELGINGVPFIYINKQEIMGETSYEELEKIVEIELQNKNLKNKK